MLRLGLRMLLGDRGKYLMLISGILFAALLMSQSMALFAGLMSWTFAPVRNIRAAVWVADAQLEQINDNKPMRETELARVRSVPGVAWAAPLFLGNVQARLPDGSFELVTLVGLDPATLAGAPAEIGPGRLEDLRLPNTVILDDYGSRRFAAGFAAADGAGEAPATVGLGAVFEMNDQEARIVGLARAYRSFTGGAFVFTTYDRALRYAPTQRKTLSFVLVGPAPGEEPAVLAARIAEATGLRAFTERDLMWATVWWYVRNTGIPINVGTLVVLGFIVGLAISAQTFYTFVLENTRNLAALKAMGLSNSRLGGMLVVQAVTVGAIGYGIGLGAMSVLGRLALATGKVPILLLPQIPAVVAVAILAICAASAVVGILHVARIEPAIVFR